MKTIKSRQFKILILILSLNILILSEIFHYNPHSNNDSKLSIDFSVSYNFSENQMVFDELAIYLRLIKFRLNTEILLAFLLVPYYIAAV